MKTVQKQIFRLFFVLFFAFIVLLPVFLYLEHFFSCNLFKKHDELICIIF